MTRINLPQIVNIINSVLFRKKVRILIYGTNAVALKLCDDLEYFNINIDFFLDDNYSSNTVYGKEVKEVAELLYEEDIDSYFILVAIENKEYQTETIPYLKSFGIKALNTLLVYTTMSISTMDVLLDFSFGYTFQHMDIEGFDIFGQIDNKESLKIVTLGGSTTYSRLARSIHCWSYHLHQLMLNEGYNVTVICGGIKAYQSYQELCKFIRDVIPMKPDIVLSYNGFNDFLGEGFWENSNPWYHRRPYLIRNIALLKKYKNVCALGLQNDVSPVDTYLNNNIMLHTIADKFEINHLCFLQPYLYSIHYKATPDEIYLDGAKERKAQKNYIAACYTEAREKIKAHDFFIDYTDIFNNYSDIYLDRCHTNDKGNKIIADCIFKDLKKRKLLVRL